MQNYDFKEFINKFYASKRKFEEKIKAIEKSNLLDIAQEQFDEINIYLAKVPKSQRNNVIKMFSDLIYLKLKELNPREFESEVIAKIFAKNWIYLLDNNKKINLRSMTTHSLNEWGKVEARINTYMKSYEKNNIQKKKSLIKSIIRLAGSGLIISYDAISLLTIKKDIFFSSFWTAALVFIEGANNIIDGIAEE